MGSNINIGTLIHGLRQGDGGTEAPYFFAKSVLKKIRRIKEKKRNRRKEKCNKFCYCLNSKEHVRGLWGLKVMNSILLIKRTKAMP